MKIALVGNYTPDRQESMFRYAELMRDGLLAAGHEVLSVAPQKAFNRMGHPANGAWKWIGYLDKYVFGLDDIQRAARQADVVHICDHSNAVYVPADTGVPYVVTCHDLLAVRGALGEDTDCPASFAGKFLQKGILAGLRRAQAIACVSAATLQDANRLLTSYEGELVLLPNALNYPYRRLEADVVEARLAGLSQLAGVKEYVLHVGSNLRRKNREVILKALAAIAPSWQGTIVFAGQALSPELLALANTLGVRHRIREVVKPDNEVLEALYNGALALMFPSRFEGFGWPVIEAQASGCPVICSDRDPMPEVAGTGALFCPVDDADAYGRAILSVSAQPPLRDELVLAGFVNAAKYGRDVMISRFLQIYETVQAAE